MAQVLRSLPAITDPNVLIGTDVPDDAGVYRLGPNQALVATVDYFTPIVDDPYAFGAIAAANALSDVYAMGARPLFALSIVGFPKDKLPLAMLGEILRGGCDKAAEAGICVIGGHSIDDPEPKYGLVVIGEVVPSGVVAKGGAKPGDRLFLTKPLGVGIVATAIKRGAATQEMIARVTDLMATLNRSAAEAMMRVGVDAGTDVTGFGLLGHLDEMLRSGGIGAQVRLEQVPVLEEAWDLAALGIVPGGTHRNLSHVQSRVTWEEGITQEEKLVLSDAQTSGGLLMAVPAEKAAELAAALKAARVPVVAEIGEVFAGEGIRVSRC